MQQIVVFEDSFCLPQGFTNCYKLAIRMKCVKIFNDRCKKVATLLLLLLLLLLLQHYSSHLGRAAPRLYHCTRGGGLPLTGQVNVALFPTDTVRLCSSTMALGGAAEKIQAHTRI